MNEFVEALDRLLADASTPPCVRGIERGAPIAPLWQAIEDSGFLDALLPEQGGGAGLSLADAFGLLVVEGRHATPVPLGHTMLARAILADAGAEAPRGAIAIACGAQHGAREEIVCRGTPYGLVADWVIAPMPHGWLLLPASAAQRTASGVHASLRADLVWNSPSAAAFVARQPLAWNEAGAVLTAAHLVGALERTLELTLQFANDRMQFGRSIGKFQAIQHQLAVMAEHVAAARMAAQIGCESPGLLPDVHRAALAKARASEAAAIVAPMAHAIHGAIGITAELDLQLFTRRLHEGRADFCAETLWNRALGRALLASGQPALDFMRAALLPT